MSGLTGGCTGATLKWQVFGFLWRIPQTSSGRSLPSPFHAALHCCIVSIVCDETAVCFTTAKIGHLHFFVSSSHRTCDLTQSIFLPILLYTCSTDSTSSMSAAVHLFHAGFIDIRFPVDGLASNTLVACGCFYTRPRCRCASSWYRHTEPPFGDRSDEGGTGNSVPPNDSLVVRLDRSLVRCFGSRLSPVFGFPGGRSRQACCGE